MLGKVGHLSRFWRPLLTGLCSSSSLAFTIRTVHRAPRRRFDAHRSKSLATPQALPSATPELYAGALPWIRPTAAMLCRLIALTIIMPANKATTLPSRNCHSFSQPTVGAKNVCNSCNRSAPAVSSCCIVRASAWFAQRNALKRVR